MSSFVTFYVLPEAKRLEFVEAQRKQKTVTYKRGFFGTKEVVTGERFLWEYLDSETADKVDLPFSGFVFIDYFLTFVAERLPEPLKAALEDAMADEHYLVFSKDQAASFAAYLQLNPPKTVDLEAFATEHQPEGGQEYIQCLRETHAFLQTWFGGIGTTKFGVVHLTF